MSFDISSFFSSGSGGSSGPGTLVPAIFSSAQGWLGDSMADDNAKRDWNYNMASAREAYDRSIGAYRNRYNWTVKDMKDAGINPIMAASGGFQVGGAVEGKALAQPGTPYPPEYSGWSSAAKNLSEVGKNISEQRKAMADAELSTQKAFESIQSIAESRSRQNLMDVEERKLWSEIQLNGQKAMESSKNMFLMEEQMEKLRVDVTKGRAEYDQIKAQEENIRKETQLLSNQIKILQANMVQLQSKADVYKTPYFGQFISGLKEILGAVGSVFGGNVSMPIK